MDTESKKAPYTGSPFRRELFMKGLRESLFSRNPVFLESVGSTNSFLKKMGDSGAPEGTLVLTEEQTAGRGRMGRPWLSPKYVNLLFSLLLRPERMDIKEAFSLTVILALAAIDGIEAVSSVRGGIKWPNDIYVGQRKVGGILTEVCGGNRKIEYAVLGLGLNVNWRPEETDSLLYPTTSISAEYGEVVSREKLLAQILIRFEAYYKEVLRAGGTESFQERFNERALFLGRDVEIETADGNISGKAIGMDKYGALIIANRKHGEQRVLYGDVRVKFRGKEDSP